MCFGVLRGVVGVLRSYGPKQLGSALARDVCLQFLVCFSVFFGFLCVLRSYGPKHLWSALFEDILGMLWCVPWCCWCAAFLWAKAVGKCSGEGCLFAVLGVL